MEDPHPSSRPSIHLSNRFIFYNALPRDVYLPNTMTYLLSNLSLSLTLSAGFALLSTCALGPNAKTLTTYGRRQDKT